MLIPLSTVILRLGLCRCHASVHHHILRSSMIILLSSIIRPSTHFIVARALIALIEPLPQIVIIRSSHLLRFLLLLLVIIILLSLIVPSALVGLLLSPSSSFTSIRIRPVSVVDSTELRTLVVIIHWFWIFSRLVHCELRHITSLIFVLTWLMSLVIFVHLAQFLLLEGWNLVQLRLSIRFLFHLFLHKRLLFIASASTSLRFQYRRRYGYRLLMLYFFHLALFLDLFSHSFFLLYIFKLFLPHFFFLSGMLELVRGRSSASLLIGLLSLASRLLAF